MDLKPEKQKQMEIDLDESSIEEDIDYDDPELLKTIQTDEQKYSYLITEESIGEEDNFINPWFFGLLCFAILGILSLKLIKRYQ